jgi:hypothetical protein
MGVVMAFTNDERFNILMAMMDYQTDGHPAWKTPEPTNDAERISRLFEVIDMLETWLNATRNHADELQKKLTWAEALLRPKRGKK